MDAIRIMLADDHTILREGLRVILSVEEDIEVVGEAGTGREAIDRYRALRPDVLVLDLHMPDLEGDAVIEALRGEEPQARVLVLTTYDGEEDVYRSLRAGAAGYLLKDTPREELIDAVRAVARGERIVPPAISARAAQRFTTEPLTDRELEVLGQVAEGRSNADIAKTLDVAEGTIKTHVGSILTKLGARARTEAVTIAIRRGLVRV